MKDVKLLASASVLRALYVENSDLYDVLSKFIESIISRRSLSAFTSIECTEYVKEDFAFCIPEAIVKSCLRKRLVQRDILSFSHGIFTVAQSFKVNKGFDAGFQESRKEYDEIIGRLHLFCSDNGLLSIEKGELEKSLEVYLTRPDKNDKYGNDIARFILTYENEPGFQDKLNRIEEGLILYAGVRYSPDLSTLGSWRGDLTIFLDLEHLFNAAGLNGILYKSLFDDFNNLVNDVNRNKKNGKITLKYFEETAGEIESFFHAAEKIISQNRSIDPSKTAMINICNGCKDIGAVITKKAEFMSKLSKLKITKESPVDYYANPEFNIESIVALEDLFSDLKESHVTMDDISSILKVFTKVNVLRKGESNVGIDRVSAIFLTESWLPQRIAFSEQVFEGNGSIPFATNIEFFTEKLWFKLNKGFGGTSKKPSSFDPIIRAKLTISNQVSKSISNIYKSLSEKLNNGHIDEATVARVHYEIYNAPSKPEDVSIDSLSMAQNFLHESYIEKVIEEKSFLERQVSEGQEAIAELRKVRHQQKLDSRVNVKSSARKLYAVLRSLIYIVTPLTCILLLVLFHSSTDSILSMIFGLVGVASLITAIARPKKLDKFFWRLSKSMYRNSIRKSNQ